MKCDNVFYDLGRIVVCGLDEHHNGNCHVVCKSCGYTVPHGSDGWHTCIKKEDSVETAKKPILTTDKKARKTMPVTRGLLDYFPKACAYVSHVSYTANEQHNPGEPMYWAREKSTDHADCIGRHLIERGGKDDDGLLHTGKLAWRALALLELELEASE